MRQAAEPEQSPGAGSPSGDPSSLPADAELRSLLSQAGCIVWQAEVTEQAGAYTWSLRVADEAAAQRVLPLEVPPGGSYVSAWLSSSVHPDDRDGLEQARSLALERGLPAYSHEYRVRDRQGRWLWLLEQAALRTLGEGRWRAAGLCIEVTERKRREAAVQEAERRYSALVEHSAEMAVMLGVDGTVLRTLPTAHSVLGYEPAQVVGRSGFDLMHPEDRDRVRLTLADLVSRPGASILEEYRLLHRDGSWRWTEALGTNLLEDPSVGAIVVSHRDVTARRLAEQKCLLHDQWLELALDAGSMGIWDWDLITDTVTWSDNMEALFGLAPGTASHDAGPFFHAIHPEDRALVGRSLDEVTERGRDWGVEFRVLWPDGSTRWIAGKRTLVQNASGEPVRVIGLAMDITERKLTEERLRETQKLESLGVMAGGIAHDYNNLLTSMLGYASLALETLPQGVPARSHIEKTVRALERAADLTHQILAYSGKGIFAVEAMDLNAMVRDNLEMLGTTLPQQIRLELDLDPALPPVRGDRGQIQQVVMNLVLNAAEAIGEFPGTVTVATTCRILSAEEAQHYASGSPPLTAGSYVCLQVRDTGVGMDAAAVARIFDPFFTTKATGRGLGLSATQGIVRAHRGGLRVRSAPGQGTNFEVLVPACPDRAARNPGLPAATEAPSGRILVVDDEDTVREVAGSILAAAGMPVLGASSGREAIELFREQWREIDAVLLDLQMPGMDGAATLVELRLINPAARVVLSSGYTNSHALMASEALGKEDFLQKPYTASALLRALRDALSRRRI